jgi:hypothetical protein
VWVRAPVRTARLQQPRLGRAEEVAQDLAGDIGHVNEHEACTLLLLSLQCVAEGAHGPRDVFVAVGESHEVLLEAVTNGDGVADVRPLRLVGVRLGLVRLRGQRLRLGLG